MRITRVTHSQTSLIINKSKLMTDFVWCLYCFEDKRVLDTHVRGPTLTSAERGVLSHYVPSSSHQVEEAALHRG